MTLKAIEGFDWTTTESAWQTKWGTIGPFATVDASKGRRGGGALYRNSGPSANMFARFSNILNAQTVVVGFAFFVGTAPTSGTYFALCSLEDTTGTGNQLSVWLEGDGSISVHRGSTATRATQIAISSAATIVGGTWYYIEIKAHIHGSTGYVEVRKDKVSILSASSLNTQNTANSVVKNVYLAGGGTASTGEFGFDDFYALDTSGSVNNDFLGDCRVDTLYPNGAGASTQWTPVGATDNWDAVNETDADGATTYVESSTAGHVDLYTFGNLPHSPSVVHGLQVSPYATRADETSRVIKSKIRSGGSTADLGSNISLTDGYRAHPMIAESNPVTSSAFTESDIDDAEFGIEVVS